MKDIMVLKGVKFKLFMLLLFYYDMWSLIGYVISVKVIDKGIEVEIYIFEIKEEGKLKDWVDEVY